MLGRRTLGRRVAGALAGAALAALAACPAQAESVLRLSMQGDLKQIDPIWTTNYTVRNAGYLIYDTLFAMDESFEVRPQMVDTYEVSDDGKTYTMTLREGLKWHDGQPVRAADCVASIERWGKKDTLGKLMMQKVSGFEVVDDRTFRIHLSEPWAHVLAALGKISSTVPFMMPERLAKTPPDEAVTEAIGSGPFRMVAEEWVPGSKVVYEKFADYVPRAEPASGAAGGKVAKVDRVEILYIPDPMTAVNALLNGEIDWIEQLPPDMLDIVRDSPAAEAVVADPLGGGGQIVLNHKQPPFDNQKIRQAVQWAVDQMDFLRAHMGDRTELYRECAAIFFCGTPLEFDVNTDRILTKNPEKAKALLKDAGYDGTPITLIHATDIKNNNDWGFVLAESLKQAGFTVDDQLTDWATVASRRANPGPVSEGGWHLFVTGWSAADLMNPLTNVFVTGACDKAWFGWPCSEELQKLHDEYAAATSPEEQVRIARELQRVAYDVVTFIPIGQMFVMRGKSTRLQGLLSAPVPFFWNVEKVEG